MIWNIDSAVSQIFQMRDIPFAKVVACSIFLIGFSAPLNAQEVDTVHCLKGCPTGTPDSNKLLIRHVFALSSNEDTKFADWVAYVVSKDGIGTTNSLVRTWKQDPMLSKDETLEPDDYQSANATLDVDRGHQAPLASFAGTIYWRETNFLSNITPQKANLNQGPWKELEQAVRHGAFHLGELHVVTGPLYDDLAMPNLPNADEHHVIPTGYWKVIASSGGKISAFIFDQSTPRDSDVCSHRSSVEQVEFRSSLNIFPQVNNWPSGTLDSLLGC